MHEEVADLHALLRPVGLAPHHVLALADLTVAHAAHGEAAEIGRRVEVGDERLEGHVFVELGRRDVLDEQLEQRLEGVGFAHAAAVATGCQQVQIMVAEHRYAGVIKLFEIAQGGQRVGAAIDHVADRPEHVF